MILRIKGRGAWIVESLQSASLMYQQMRDSSGEGHSTFPSGTVVCPDSGDTWRVSYNGRVWRKVAGKWAILAEATKDGEQN